MGKRAVNDQTGEVFELVDGKWKKLKTARNDDTGEIFILSGDQWEPLQKTAPEQPQEQIPDDQTIGQERAAPLPEDILSEMEKLAGGGTLSRDMISEEIEKSEIEELKTAPGSMLFSNESFDQVLQNQSPQYSVSDPVTKPERNTIQERVSGYMSDASDLLAVEGSLLAPSGQKSLQEGLISGFANFPSQFVGQPVETTYEMFGRPVEDMASGYAGTVTNLFEGDTQGALAEASRMGTGALMTALNATMLPKSVKAIGKTAKQAASTVPEAIVGSNPAQRMAELAEDAVRGVDNAFKPDPSKLSKGEAGASDVLIKELERDGIDVNDFDRVARKMRERTKGTQQDRSKTTDIVGEAGGPHVRKLMRAGVNVPGEMATKGYEVLKDRADKTFERLLGASDKVKNQNFTSERKAIIAARKEAADEAYDAFRNTAIDQAVFDEKIAPMLASEDGKALLASVERNLKRKANKARMGATADEDDVLKFTADELDELAQGVADYRAGKSQSLPAAVLDEAKKGFDDLIAKEDAGSHSQSILRSSKNSFRDVVDEASGGAYGVALDIFGGGKAIESAYELGTKAGTMKTWQLEKAIDDIKASYPRFGTDQADALASGFSRAIRDMLETNDMATARRILRDRKLSENFRSIMGEEQWKRFSARVEKVVQQEGTRKFLFEGSRTTPLAQDIAEFTYDGSVDRALSRIKESGVSSIPSIEGMFINLMSKPSAALAEKVITSMRRGGIKDPEINAILADWLFAPATEGNVKKIVATLNKRLAEKGKKPVDPAKSVLKNKEGGTSAAVAGGAGSGGVAGAGLDVDGDGEAGTAKDIALSAFFGGVAVKGIGKAGKGGKRNTQAIQDKQRQNKIDSWYEKSVKPSEPVVMGKMKEEKLAVNDDFEINILTNDGSANISFLRDGQPINDPKILPEAMMALTKHIKDTGTDSATIIAANKSQENMLENVLKAIKLDGYKAVKSTMVGGKGSQKAADNPYYMITKEGNSGKHFADNPNTKHQTFPLDGRPVSGNANKDEWLLEDNVKAKQDAKPYWPDKPTSEAPKLGASDQQAAIRSEMRAQQAEASPGKRKTIADLMAENEYKPIKPIGKTQQKLSKGKGISDLMEETNAKPPYAIEDIVAASRPAGGKKFTLHGRPIKKASQDPKEKNMDFPYGYGPIAIKDGLIIYHKIPFRYLPNKSKSEKELVKEVTEAIKVGNRSLAESLIYRYMEPDGNNAIGELRRGQWMLDKKRRKTLESSVEVKQD